jgi:molecular chaperone GrpE
MKHKKKEQPKEHEPTETPADRQAVEKSELDTIDALQKEKDELFAKLQRVSADYANFQKRVPKQIADTIVYEKERIIRTLLPALDNLEHTLQNAHSAENVEIVVKGVRIIYDQMLDILRSHGVEQMKAAGETFDPARHEAMMRKAEPEQQADIVLEEFQKGYELNGRVIRPSKVIVNKPATEVQVEDQQQADETETNEAEAADPYETTDTE